MRVRNLLYNLHRFRVMGVKNNREYIYYATFQVR